MLSVIVKVLYYLKIFLALESKFEAICRKLFVIFYLSYKYSNFSSFKWNDLKQPEIFI